MSKLQIKNMDLYETQKLILQQILNDKRKAGVIKSDEEYQVEYDYWLRAMESGEPAMKIRPQEEETNPDDFNLTYQELELDIMTAFSQINQVDQAVNKHQQLNQGIMNNLKLSLSKMGDELAQYERLADYLSSEQIMIESFRDSNSFEGENDNLYTERNASVIGPSYKAKLHIDREAVTLPTISAHNRLIGPSGVRLGTIRITKQLGGGLIRIQNPENGIEKAIDTSQETFWSETILVDEPIRVQMGKDYYNINQGAVCELTIKFDTLSQVNQITFHPFTEFPLEIVAIQYYNGDDINEAPKEIIAPQLQKGLRSQYASGPLVYQFNDIQAKRIRIILNQIHYVKTDYVTDTKRAEQLTLWFASNVDVKPDEVVAQTPWYYSFKPIYANKVEMNSGYHYFNRALKGIDPDLDKLVGEEEVTPTGTATSKYAYNYGLYDVTTMKNDYYNTGVYVSKALNVDGNVKAMTLETDEEHPYGGKDIAPFTDIEYYITNMENPTEDTWYPIMSSNVPHLFAELLYPVFLDGKYKAKLRFNPEPYDMIRVRKDGVEIFEVIGDFTVAGNEIVIRNFDPSAVYVCDYTPLPESYKVDFIEKHTDPVTNKIVPNVSIENYYGSNTEGEVALKYHTFSDRARLNSQPSGWNPSYLSNDYLPAKVKLILKSGFHIDQPYSDAEQDPIVVVNKTNYFDIESSTLDPFNPELNNYQYIIRGNKLVFNTRLDESVRIIVEYAYIIGQVRLKAILRRNINYFYGLSPILNEYTLKYQPLL